MTVKPECCLWCSLRFPFWVKTHLMRAFHRPPTKVRGLVKTARDSSFIIHNSSLITHHFEKSNTPAPVSTMFRIASGMSDFQPRRISWS